MTKAKSPQENHCQDCASWVKLSEQDGGIGICDSLPSDHNQHLVGHWHPACEVFIALTEAKGEDDG